ncbi:VOC family protein [Aliidiomarina haloalkalitolerans]|uniref:Glyoxalase n=1 Tax=Aliidiomarina haloalkalitolerans TaxID=859059 RepID=A0A432VQB0_9GAMM|nr:VOC family protein [Aliidiomarina haloalkalitolerans]RUO18368.1 glyoxalase [Aliidiomarina haloalkalitolerans]
MTQFSNSISYITLGVDDLERSLRFYRDGLGLATKGIIGSEHNHGAVVFFDFQPGLRLALWPRKSISAECHVSLSAPDSSGFMLAHNVRKRSDVDTIVAQAQAAGAEIVRAPKEFSWGGYGGVFKDPDHHLWEVVWNPHDGSGEPD